MRRTVVMSTVVGSLLCGLFFSHEASGQSLSFGTRLGVTRPNLVAESETVDTPGNESRTGFVGAVSVGLLLSDAWSVQSELGLAGKGTNGSSPDFVMRSTYVEIPLYLRVDAPRDQPGFFPSLLAGGAIAWEVHCGGKTIPGFPGGPRPAPVPLDCSGMRSDRFDAAILFGAGLGWTDGERTLRVEFRYTHGLSDIGSEWKPIQVFNRSVSAAARLEVPWRPT